MRKSDLRETDQQGSASERFYTINRLISSSLMKHPPHDRALTNSQHEYHAQTQRQSSHNKRRDHTDPIDRLSGSGYYTAPKKTRRTRIFQQLPMQIQHLQLGAELSNLNFEELDKSLLPRIFYSGKCGCDNSLRPCQRLTKQLTEQMIQMMRGQYERLKNKDPHGVSYLIVKDLMQGLPQNYPEAFSSITENLLQLLQVDEHLFPMLYSIVWHAKTQYLSYFIYREMAKMCYQESSILPELEHYVQRYSKDLTSLMDEASKEPLQEFCSKFMKSGGISLVPIAQYGKYIEHLNRTGKSYPPRLLFCVLLICKKSIRSDGPTIGKFLQKHGQRLRYELPWGLIFEAAQHHYLK